MEAQEILSKLRELKPILLQRYKVREIALFGSFVRGEQSVRSDIDVLVEFEESADLFDLLGLELYLSDTFQRPVDVVPRQALRVELQESVLRQAVAV